MYAAPWAVDQHNKAPRRTRRLGALPTVTKLRDLKCGSD